MLDPRFLKALAEPRAKVVRIMGSTLEILINNELIKVASTPWLQAIRRKYGHLWACDALIALCRLNRERGFEPTKENETLYLTLLNLSN